MHLLARWLTTVAEWFGYYRCQWCGAWYWNAWDDEVFCSNECEGCYLDKHFYSEAND
jgi:hypothetical protein